MIYLPKAVVHGFKDIRKELVMLYLIDKTLKKPYDKSIMPFPFHYDWKLTEPIFAKLDKNVIHLMGFISEEIYMT
jgi:dTDP-4-dehydrorhamnose 3,5-epimerase-like enzyme